MSSSNLQNDYKEHLEAAIHQLLRFGKDGDPERMHQFRVAIKRIRAIYRFLEAVHPSPKEKKDKKAIQKIFRQAGVIRELDLKIAWLKKYGFLNLVRKFGLEQDLSRELKAFQGKLKSSIKTIRKTSGKVTTPVKKINDEKVTNYLSGLMNSISERVKSKPDEKLWHDIRKVIKRALFAGNWLTKNRKAKFNRLLFIKELNTLQALIGQWHDDIVLRDWLGQEQPFLSRDELIKKEFGQAWIKLENSIKSSHAAIARRFTRLAGLKYRGIIQLKSKG